MRAADDAGVRILDENSEADSRILTRLRSDPAVAVLDRRKALRAAKPDAARLTPCSEGDRWVWYPWRRALVGLPGPDAFRRLRQAPADLRPDLAGRLRIGIVGQRTGHAIADTLALEGICAELRLAPAEGFPAAEPDRFSCSVFDFEDGRTVAAVRRISELDPYLRVLAYPEGLTLNNLEAFVGGLDLVIDDCDSYDLKTQLRQTAKALQVPVLRVSIEARLMGAARLDPQLSSAIAAALRRSGGDNARMPPLGAIEAVLHAIRQAPLAGGVQSSAVIANPHELRIRIAGDRASRTAISHLDSCIATGAALYSARVAAAAHGILGPVELGTTSHGPVALLRFAGGSDSGLAKKYPGMIATDRRRVAGRPVQLDAQAAEDLTLVTHREGARLALLTDPAAIEAAEQLLRAVGRRRSHAEQALRRRSDAILLLSKRGKGGAVTLRCSAMAAVLIGGSSDADYVHAGSALQSLCVEAERCGLVVRPDSPALPDDADDTEALRARFARLFGVAAGETAIMVLRLCHVAGDGAQRRSLRPPVPAAIAKVELLPQG